MLTFSVEIAQTPDAKYIYLEVPEAFSDTLTHKKKLKFQGFLDEIPWKGVLTPMLGTHVILLNYALKIKLDKNIGELINVQLEEESEPKEIEIPEELLELLDQFPDAQQFFETLSYNQKKEYADWIHSAKKESTRDARIQKAIDSLREGKKHP